jgi:hypothetical protein
MEDREATVKRNGHYIYDTCARTLPACPLGVPLEFAPESPKRAALGTIPVCPRFAPNENDDWGALGQAALKTERPVKRNGHYI